MKSQFYPSEHSSWVDPKWTTVPKETFFFFFYQQEIIIPDKLATKTLMCNGSWILRKRSIYVPIGKFEGFFFGYIRNIRI